MSRGTLLGVWAHPDDEAYLMAGLALRARAAGRRVVVATATWGEHGTDQPDRWPPEALREQRRQELRHSLAALDVTEHSSFELEDGTCADLPHRVGVGLVRALVDEIRPDTVVTFGPDGMTGHADHRAVSAWTTTACAGRGAPRLWYAAVTDAFHRRWGDLNERVGLWMADPPPATPATQLAHRVQLRSTELDRKLAALRAHVTQTARLEALVGVDRYRRWWSEECFRDASAPRTTAGSRPEDPPGTVLPTAG
jgi:LmbE family N-acetylglucosaminyl deacetylase